MSFLSLWEKSNSPLQKNKDQKLLALLIYFSSICHHLVQYTFGIYHINAACFLKPVLKQESILNCMIF